jgi:hypothetical protein
MAELLVKAMNDVFSQGIVIHVDRRICLLEYLRMSYN